MTNPDVLTEKVKNNNGVIETIITIPVGGNQTVDFNVVVGGKQKTPEGKGKTPTPKRHTLGSVGGDQWEDFE